MTLYQFVRFSPENRMEEVNGKGSFICGDADLPSNYYLIEDFYVEVGLNK